MITRYFVYGTIGWIMEIIWTGLHSLQRKEYRLIATTSIWMFFIYGLVVFLEPICDMITNFPVILRGGVYALCIFTVELIAGLIMKKMNACPWDYSDSKYSFKGVIRFDYAPVWFVAGIIFELIYRKL